MNRGCKLQAIAWEGNVMLTPEIEEFAKRLVERIRDGAIGECDALLRPLAGSPMTKRWKSIAPFGRRLSRSLRQEAVRGRLPRAQGSLAAPKVPFTPAEEFFHRTSIAPVESVTYRWPGTWIARAACGVCRR